MDGEHELSKVIHDLVVLAVHVQPESSAVTSKVPESPAAAADTDPGETLKHGAPTCETGTVRVSTVISPLRVVMAGFAGAV